MRIVLLLWGFPIVFFWGWYFLSLNDMHFGMFFLSRAFHDHLFVIYGNILQMDPQSVPGALAWLFAVDTLIVVGLAALGKYRKLWFPFLVQAFKTHILRRQPQEAHVKALYKALAKPREVRTEQRDPIATAIGPMHPAE